MTQKKLHDRNVLITGAARGIGRCTAEHLLRAGARVVITDLDLEVAEATARDLGSDVRAYRMDVRSKTEFEAVVDRVERERGTIDVLVNNAGIMSLGSFMDHDEANDRKQVDVNIFGVIHGMRAMIPRMRARGAGHIINVASMAGKVGLPYAAVYSATKFAVVGLTQAVRVEEKDSGIRFSYVMPALVNTDLASGAGKLRWPRLVEPEEVAEAIVDAAVTGALEVYVPKLQKVASLAPTLLPPTLFDLVGKAVGTDRFFRDVDRDARRAYVARTTGRSEGTKD